MADSILWQSVTALFASWYDAKLVIEQAGSISSDAMHVIAGVLLQILFAVILRRPMSNWLPWLAVFTVLLFNEAVDLWAERWPSLAMQIGESGKDLWLTMFLPAVLLLAFRMAPTLTVANRAGRRHAKRRTN